ncbi:hybrid sensor histidine kinase/response regulator transcription factor [Aliikangiella coralliicola]|uniref:histidine kinase n=1 Tax=Aliikangiella coralliicola TaxID=2592383 RepID=A0A545UGQ5_9GAMM|nr:ATP-binding protein [Aliikangiella coralliicola]TQV88658.1 response regulator [Aliikangiella coralliicola]
MKLKPIISFLVIPLFFISIHSYPKSDRVFQTKIFETFTKKNGLGSNSVFDIYRSSDGFLWVGTVYGLYRYDGVRFSLVNIQDIMASKYWVHHVTGDLEKNIWLSIYPRTIVRYNTRTSSTKLYNLKNKHGELLDEGKVTKVFVDSSNDIWVGTTTNLQKLNRKINQFEEFPLVSNNKKSTIDSVSDIVQEGKKLWIGTNNGIVELDHNNSYKRHLPAFLRDTNNFQVVDIEKSNDGYLWVATSKNIYKFNSKKNNDITLLDWKEKELCRQPIKKMFFDDANRIWLSFSGDSINICVINIGKFSAREILSSNAFQSSFKNDDFYQAHQDQEGIIWFGTDGGLVKLSKNLDVYEFFTATTSKGLLMSMDKIHNNLFMSSNGFWHFDRETLLGEKLLEHEIQSSGILNGIGIYYTKRFQGRVNVYFYDSSSKRNIEATALNKTLSNLNINNVSLIGGDNGYLWVVTSKGVIRYQHFNKKIAKIFWKKRGLKSKISPFYLRNFDSQVWGCAMDGELFYSDLNGANLQKVTLTNRNQVTLRCNTISQGLGRYLWVGAQAGVFSVDMLSKNVKHVHDVDVYVGRTVETDTDLWIESEGLFYIFNKESEKHSIVDLSRFEDISTASYYSKPYIENNVGFFPYLQKSLKLSFDKFEHPEEHVKVNFSDFYLNNNKVDLRNHPLVNTNFQIPYVENLEIKYSKSTIKFDFFSSNFSVPHKVKYRYKLDGYDEDWLYANYQQNFASYPSLFDGVYTLKVQARIEDSEQWGPVRELTLTITPPPWRTWLAYSFYFIAIGFILYSIYQYRLRVLTRKAKELEQQVKQRTEQIEIQKETIKNLLERKNEMFANVSHEFRTPLTLIIGPVNSFIQKHKDYKVDFMPVINNAKRLLRMVDQLLDIARIDSDQKSDFEIINLSELVKKIAVNMQSLAEERKLNIKINVSDSAYVQVNYDAAEKVIVNLVSNAIKYNSPNGTISIKLETNKDKVFFSISDTGIGIPSSEQERIFERFVRLEQNETDIPGAGIGLALVKELVERYQGKISIKSEIDQGSCFSIEWPKAENKEHLHSSEINTEIDLDSIISTQEVDAIRNSQSTIEVSSQEETLAENKPKVLIVEDHPEMRAMLNNLLNSNYDCELAKNGSEGIEKAINTIPDLVITDLMMPGKSGFDVAKALRNDTKTSHIPIILLTAKGDIGSRLTAWKTEIDEFITKPFDQHELLVRCQNLLNIRRLLSSRVNSQLNNVNHDERVSLEGISLRDQEFIKSLEDAVESRYSNDKLTVSILSGLLFMSEKQLQRKVKALLNQSIPDYVRNYRMRKAAELLESGMQVSQTAFEVGFSSASYFGSCFKACFGVNPSEYLKQKNR